MCHLIRKHILQSLKSSHSTWETETAGLWAWDQPSLCDRGRPSLKETTTKKRCKHHLFIFFSFLRYSLLMWSSLALNLRSACLSLLSTGGKFKSVNTMTLLAWLLHFFFLDTLQVTGRGKEDEARGRLGRVWMRPCRPGVQRKKWTSGCLGFGGQGVGIKVGDGREGVARGSRMIAPQLGWG